MHWPAPLVAPIVARIPSAMMQPDNLPNASKPMEGLF